MWDATHGVASGSVKMYTSQQCRDDESGGVRFGGRSRVSEGQRVDAEDGEARHTERKLDEGAYRRGVPRGAQNVPWRTAPPAVGEIPSRAAVAADSVFCGAVR